MSARMSPRARRFASWGSLVTLGVGALGCGGGGSGGSSTPLPTNTPPMLSTAAVTPLSVVGGQDDLTITWDGSDPDGHPLTALIRPDPNSALLFQPSRSTSATTFTYRMPQVAADTQAAVILQIDDGHGGLVTRTFSVLVRAPGPVLPPPPPLNQLDTFGLDVLTRTNRQVVRVHLISTWVDVSQITASVDGQPARVLRYLGAVNQAVIALDIELPRFEQSATRTLAVNFPGTSGPATIPVVYRNVGSTWAIVDFEHSDDWGRVLALEIDGAGVASAPVDLVPGGGTNGPTIKSFAPGATREEFWILAHGSGGDMVVQYANARTKQVGSFVPFTQTFPESIASFGDGSRAVIAWRDFANTGTWWVTIVRNDLTVLGSVALIQAGKEALTSSLMSPVQTIEFFNMAATGNLTQTYAVLPQLSPAAIYFVPIEHNPNQDYFKNVLSVTPQHVRQVFDFPDRETRLFAVGRHASASVTSAQEIFVGFFNPIQLGTTALSNSTTNLLGAAFDRDSDGHLNCAVVHEADFLYLLRDMVDGTSEVVSTPLNSRTRQFVDAPGSAWFLVASGSLTTDTSDVDVVHSLSSFTAPVRRPNTSTRFTNAVAASERHVIWELRGPDTIVVDELAGSSAPQVLAEPPSSGGSGLGRMCVSRTLCR